MADPGPLVRFDDGRGNRLKLGRKDAEARVRQNPGSFIVEDRGRRDEAQAEAREGGLGSRREEAPGQQDEDELEAMKVAELREYAEQHEIDITGARTKAEIIERIEASDGGGKPEAEGEPTSEEPAVEAEAEE